MFDWDEKAEEDDDTVVATVVVVVVVVVVEVVGEEWSDADDDDDEGDMVGIRNALLGSSLAVVLVALPLLVMAGSSVSWAAAAAAANWSMLLLRPKGWKSRPLENNQTTSNIRHINNQRRW